MTRRSIISPRSSSPTYASHEAPTRSCGPQEPISGIVSRATRRASGQASKRTEARPAAPLLLVRHPSLKPLRRKKNCASSSKLKTGRTLSSPSTPSVRTSGGPPSAPTSSFTINQDVSNLVLAHAPTSIALSIIPSLALPGHRLSGSRAGHGHPKVHRVAAREHSQRTQPRM